MQCKMKEIKGNSKQGWRLETNNKMCNTYQVYFKYNWFFSVMARGKKKEWDKYGS